MSDLMEYKGYHTKPEYSAEDNCFVGKVLGIRDSISFHGFSVEEFGGAFHEAVDDYLALCEEHGKTPDKEYSGQFVLRVPPELHKELSIEAERRGDSLNAFVTNLCASSIKTAV